MALTPKPTALRIQRLREAASRFEGTVLAILGDAFALLDDQTVGRIGYLLSQNSAAAMTQLVQAIEAALGTAISLSEAQIVDFYTTIARIADAQTLAAAEKLGVVDFFPVGPPPMDPASPEWAAWVAAAEAVQVRFPSLTVEMGAAPHSPPNPWAVRQARAWRGNFITEMANGQAKVLAGIVADNLSGAFTDTGGALGPRQLAGRIRDGLSLTKDQVGWVSNFDAELGRLVDDLNVDIRSWGLLPPDPDALAVYQRRYGLWQAGKIKNRPTLAMQRIAPQRAPVGATISVPDDPVTGRRLRSMQMGDERLIWQARYNPIAAERAAARKALAARRPALVTAYRENIRSYRATVIARTESLRALNAATFDSMREQGARLGAVMTRGLKTAGDGRVSPEHAAAAANPQNKAVPLEQPFMVGGIPHQSPPFRPNCRCIAVFDIDMEASLARLRRHNGGPPIGA